MRDRDDIVGLPGLRFTGSLAQALLPPRLFGVRRARKPVFEASVFCHVWTNCLYDAIMYEWDEAKRLKNLEKHSLDFRDARLIFDGRPVIHVPALKNNEVRFASVAMVDTKSYTVIWTWRANRRRIISFRRARHGEESAYREIFR